MNSSLSNDFLILARLSLTGRPQDINLLLHKTMKKYRMSDPELVEQLSALINEVPTRSTPLRKFNDSPLPVDVDSRLQLLKIDHTTLENNPLLALDLKENLEQLLIERRNLTALSKHGLHPTKSVLFTGPPGVGKTMTAKWIAAKLGKPLLVLDLAAVMSSYLGRTGNNVRYVLDYAKSVDCVLLLDELDSIAKRRDDNSEVGELKRLVTVLLQEIDDWPDSGLLIAATNHPDLLDPAVWRRFEMILKFSNPDRSHVENYIKELLQSHLTELPGWSEVLSYVFLGRSFSEIEHQINLVRKAAAIDQSSIEEKLKQLISSDQLGSKDQRVTLATTLVEKKLMSQRKATELTGVARETIRKRTKNI